MANTALFICSAIRYKKKPLQKKSKARQYGECLAGSYKKLETWNSDI